MKMNFVWFSAQCVVALFADDAHANLSKSLRVRSFTSWVKMLFSQSKATRTDHFESRANQRGKFDNISYLFITGSHVQYFKIFRNFGSNYTNSAIFKHPHHSRLITDAGNSANTNAPTSTTQGRRCKPNTFIHSHTIAASPLCLFVYINGNCNSDDLQRSHCDWQIVPNLIDSFWAFAPTNQCKCRIALKNWKERSDYFWQTAKKDKEARTDMLTPCCAINIIMPVTVVDKRALFLLEREIESTVHGKRKRY